MHASTFFIAPLLVACAAGLAIPSVPGDDIVIRKEVDDIVIRTPGARVVNPAAVTGTVCTAAGTFIVDHDINVALLAICGGIAGTIEQCGGSPTTTTGSSGTALFTLNAATAGQTIDITKGRWEGCVAAARATCGDSPFTSTCIGGADVNAGNVDFALTSQ